jgi:elongation factor 1-alpha
MAWWKGADVKSNKVPVHCDTLLDCLEKMVKIPKRPVKKALRMPVSGVYKIKGVGDVITGRVEQGKVEVGKEMIFLPTHTASKPCTGKIFSIEMHHKTHPAAFPGDNVGLNVKGLSKENMPRVGDCMILKDDVTLKACGNFTAQVQILDHPGELKVGYSPIAFIRTARSACRISKINWKIGKETGGQKAENPPHLKANEMAEIVFEPQQPFVCEAFSSCEGLGRVAILEGASVVMLGKAVAVEFKIDEKKK